MFSTSREESKSLTFWVMPVGYLNLCSKKATPFTTNGVAFMFRKERGPPPRNRGPPNPITRSSKDRKGDALWILYLR